MPNRLAAETSPYLRQHAGNPVDWLPWGEEAFARARAEQKPIFLSIGYSTCHWCHVMAHESFENPEVAVALNRDFIPVKLDREERPDVDRLYMTFVQATTGSGGWPLSVWLTPELRPFFGGTYFPPDDRYGRPGLKALLRLIAQGWTRERDKFTGQAEQVMAGLQRQAREGGARPEEAAAGQPAPEQAVGAAFGRALHYYNEAFDATQGGFGGAPKFPRPSALVFLFRAGVRPELAPAERAEAVRMAAFTLQKMAEGGIHDHVGGGFHRYAVDDEWFVPHFEKMLYDQAQLVIACLEARRATGSEVFAWIARDILAYVQRDLADPAGGFYSAEDADSPVGPGSHEQAEGAFYVWTQEQLESELGTEAGLFGAHFGVKPGGNVAHDPHGEFHGRNILHQVQSLAVTARQSGLEPAAANDRLLGSLERLRQARSNRPRPHRDEKILTAWNALMLSALTRAHQVLGPAEVYLAAATRTAEFLQRELWDAATGTLYRSWGAGRRSIPAFAEDHAALVQALIDLYEAGFEIRWLQWAEQLQSRMNDLFWDDESGGYFNSRVGDTSVIVRLKDDHDGAEPAANSVALANLVRLDLMLGNGAAGGDVLTYR
ncbi:MAG: thioredoxin domain-containing protein, partial [Opitutales bacterium]